MDKGIIRHILDDDEAPAAHVLPPHQAVELAHRIHQDAVTVFCGPILPFASINTWEDLEKIPDLGVDGFRKALEPYCKALAGTGVGLNVLVWGPFFISYLGMGPVQIQDFFLKLYEDLPFCEAVLDKVTDAQIAALDSIMDLPFDMIEIGDDTCDHGGYMCSAELMDQVWVPRMKKIVDRAAQKDVPLHWHLLREDRASRPSPHRLGRIDGQPGAAAVERYLRAAGEVG